MENTIEIICADGRQLAARHFPHHGPQRRGVIIINSATGVAQRYYQPFAEYFARAGFAVVTWDARGIGQSRQGHPKHETARMRDWGLHDLDAVLRSSVDTLGADWAEVSVIGHSSGGHLSALAPALHQVPRLLLIASGTGNWRKYPKGQWPRLLGAWHAAMPLMLMVFGYVPGWVGIGHDLPRGVAEDWRNWCLNADYLFSDATLDSSGYARYAGKVLALSFTDDHGYAPATVVDDLLAHFPLAAREHRQIHPPAVGRQAIGHFAYFRPANQDLWEELESWLAPT